MSNLDRLFVPESIALIGASSDPNKLSGRPYRFLKEYGYQGEIYLVNPQRDVIEGRKCYDSVMDIPGPVDVAMILVGARHACDLLAECGRSGIPFAIVIAGGFAESGPEGAALQAELVKTAKQTDIRLVGPNCQGLINFEVNAIASFSSILKREDIRVGNVGFVSQSGGFGGALFQYMQNVGIGASKLISTGNEADIDTIDVMEHFVEDPTIDIIATHIESVDDGSRLVELGRRAAETDTDIVALRVGISKEGKAATASHTGSIATDDAIYDGVFRQAGITRVRSINEFADTIITFSHVSPNARPKPDSGLGIVTISGGAAALIADECGRTGVRLAELDEATESIILERIPSYGSETNPVDVTGRAISDPQVYDQCVRAIVDDPDVGCVILQFGNSGPETIEACKESLISIRDQTGIPIGTVFTGALPNDETKAELNEAKIPQFEDPVRAVTAFANLYERIGYTENRATTHRKSKPEYRTPTLDDWESATTILSDFGIRFAKSIVAGSRTEAVSAADEIGYPIAMKIDPLDVEHKSEVGGVKMRLDDADAVKRAYEELIDINASREVIVQQTIDGIELITGIVNDDDFGPVMLFGPGGIFVELFEDAFAYRALPIDESTASDLIVESNSKALLSGYRTLPEVDQNEIRAQLIALSTFYESTDITEIELNPMIATEDGCFAVDLLIER